MHPILTGAVNLYRDERAVTALEYGIISGVLGLVVIAVFGAFGASLQAVFNTIGAAI